MTPVLKAALWGQVVWFVSASGYNLLSLLAMAEGHAGFAGDAATTRSAMVAVLIFGSVTVTGLLHRMSIYRLLAPIVVAALFIGGVVKHVRLGPADYASEASWIVAILINSFGVIVYAIGSVCAFRRG